jgi:hypothetical protein
VCLKNVNENARRLTASTVKSDKIRRIKIHQKQQKKLKSKSQTHLAHCFMTNVKERMKKSKVNLLFPLARLIQLIICSQTSSS